MVSQREYLQALKDIYGLAYLDVLEEWDKVSGKKAREISEHLAERAPVLVDNRGAQAAALAADHYDDARDLSPHVKRDYTATVTEPTRQGKIDALTNWANKPIIKSAIINEVIGFSNFAAGLQKLLSEQANDTTLDNVRADPEARGWMRVTSPGAWDFCIVLAGRDGVYSEESVRFASHTDCACGAVPSWDPNAEQVDVFQYDLSKPRAKTDQSAMRNYIKENQLEIVSHSHKRRPKQFVDRQKEQASRQLEQVKGLDYGSERNELTSQMDKILAGV